MVYLTQEDVEASGAGYGYGDLKQAGTAMNAQQWQRFCDQLIDSITAAINSYCKVTSFEQATYTEYHNGRGATGDLGEYTERDRIFMIREQPVNSITSVSEDIASSVDAPSWEARVQRAVGIAAGSADYSIVARGTLSYIRFDQNVPASGTGNVKIVYVAGYDPDSAQLDAIRMIAQQISDNFLAKKKALQEASAARTIGTKDSVDMFKVQAADVFTPDIKMQLDNFKRTRAMGPAWR